MMAVTTLNTPLELPLNAHTYLQRKRNQSAPPVFHLNAAAICCQSRRILIHATPRWMAEIMRDVNNKVCGGLDHANHDCYATCI